MAGDLAAASGRTFSARPYQLEMFEESMKRNIIISMDTGSGKTQVAVLRIAAELERCSQDKLIWMLCPTVALAEQQCQVLVNQLPAYQCRTLSSQDNVDHWSSKSIWDAALRNMHVIVSTPQVLYDALVHGFVRVEQFALWVFDEAHHCHKKHVTNKIMQGFYHPAKSASKTVPYILGLTASPAKSSNNMVVMEQNLNAVCKAPRLHADDLRQYVHRPQLLKLTFGVDASIPSPLLVALQVLVSQYDIAKDPYVVSLQADKRPRMQDALGNALQKRRTPSLEQLKRLNDAAQDVFDQLGPWAFDHYLRTSIGRLAKAAERPIVLLSDLAGDTAQHLSRLLSPLLSLPETQLSLQTISPKVNVLIEFLVKEFDFGLNGIIFVQRRCTAVVLAALLSADSRLLGKYMISPFVGQATHFSKGSNLAEIADSKLQREALSGFRGGTHDLLVSTSVLEEGIDVSATNLVIRFDPPPNLRSYVQSRGRARKEQSKFVMMLPYANTDASVTKWDDLEEEMKALYTQAIREIAERIQHEDEVREECSRVLEVPTTGARLTFDDAVSHLHHFCGTLSTGPYVDNKPEFILHRDDSGRISGKVVLPATVNPALRETCSMDSWLTEKMAKADCAFQAYQKLYNAGLVSDHLLPVRTIEETTEIETRDSFASVRLRYDIWALSASLWGFSKIYTASIRICSEEGRVGHLRMFLPLELKSQIVLALYWNSTTTIEVIVTPSGEEPMYALLRSLYSRTMPELMLDGEHPCHPYLLVMIDERNNVVPYGSKTARYTPSATKTDFQNIDYEALHAGLVRWRDRPLHVRPYECISVIRRWPGNSKIDDGDNSMVVDDGSDQSDVTGASDASEISQENVWLELRQIPKRLDFLHVLEAQHAHTAIETYPASEFGFDPFPVSHARTMLFFPSICHRMELRLLAEQLNESILRGIGIKDISLVEAAISAPSAREEISYDRIEYLGDALLKVHASLQVYAENPIWHEGRLSLAKSAIINNAHLSKAAMRLGLDRFIHTEPFKGAKWRPAFNHELQQRDQGEARNLSTKTLADVVEALIGAAHLDGADANSREDKTLASLHVLLPEIRWRPLADLTYQMMPKASGPESSFANLEPLQDLLGYRFRNPLLLVSALTHPSVLANSTACSSYEQLEFIGDALLDKVLVETMFHYLPSKILPQSTMTLIHHALANGQILGFFCLQAHFEILKQEPIVDPVTKVASISNQYVRHYLWQFMRHAGSPAIIAAQKSSMARFDVLASSISEAFSRGSAYPWIPLLQLFPEKFCSDIIESILGAIFIDSGGNIEMCRSWLRKLGLLSFLERVLDEDVDCVHPKMKVGILAGNRTVKYKIEKSLSSASSAEPDMSAPNPNIEKANNENELNATLIDQASLTRSSSNSSSLSSCASSESKSATSLRMKFTETFSALQLKGPFECTILIEDEIYAVVRDGKSREEVEARAAAEAIRRIQLEVSSTETKPKAMNEQRNPADVQVLANGQVDAQHEAVPYKEPNKADMGQKIDEEQRTTATCAQKDSTEWRKASQSCHPIPIPSDSEDGGMILG